MLYLRGARAAIWSSPAIEDGQRKLARPPSRAVRGNWSVVVEACQMRATVRPLGEQVGRRRQTWLGEHVDEVLHAWPRPGLHLALRLWMRSGRHRRSGANEELCLCDRVFGRVRPRNRLRSLARGGQAGRRSCGCAWRCGKLVERRGGGAAGHPRAAAGGGRRCTRRRSREFIEWRRVHFCDSGDGRDFLSSGNTSIGVRRKRAALSSCGLSSECLGT
mmetsp:Transcript_26047/g.65638  ORF Transcript_26047/g.65638 Transcript_26047/m.65638 type:complete len:218 (+) Transcript_26047:766-1419(+)